MSDNYLCLLGSSRLVQSKGIHNVSSRNCYVLLAVDSVRDRGRLYESPKGDVPQFFPGHCVESKKISVSATAEDDIAGSGENPGS